MTRQCKLRLMKVLFELALMAALVAVSIPAGISALAHWHGPAFTLSNELFLPSLMMASGRGFVNVMPSEVPGLPKFLDFEAPAFSPGQIPAELTPVSLDSSEKYHRYLLYAVGCTWSLFGVSWDALKILLVALLCITGLLSYGLFRLGMNPLLSAVGSMVFVVAPPCLGVLPNLRDFSKAPFVLAAMLLLGWLIKKPMKRRAFWGISMLLGLIIGVGIGFRRDLMMSVPPCLVILALCQRAPARRVIAERIVAIGLLLASFTLAAWPILTAFREDGSLGYHDILMGMSMPFDYELGLKPASYERLYEINDMLVTTSAVSHCYRNACQDPRYFTQDNDIRERNLLRDIAWTFPSDMIARCYSAVGLAMNTGILWKTFPFNIRSGDWEWVWAQHLERYGPVYALFAFLVLAAGNLRTACLVLFMLFYFCGYLTLQFSLRHCFHAGFIGLWFPGFLLDQGVRGILRTVWRRVKPGGARVAPRLPWGTWIRRALVFVLIAGIVVSAPFYAAWLWQSHTVGKIFEACASADLETIEVESVPLNEDQVMIRLRNWPVFLPAWSRGQELDLQSDYVAAVFARPGTPACFWVRYETHTSGADFSHAVNSEPTGTMDGGTLRYFFPVYEWSTPEEWTRFAGVVLPKERAKEFLGLYRVRNIGDFRLLLNISLPEQKGGGRKHEVLQWPPERGGVPGCIQDPIEAELQARIQSAGQRAANGDVDGAIGIYQAELPGRPENLELLMGLGRAFELKGDFDAALKVYHEGHGGQSHEYHSLQRTGRAASKAGNAGRARGRMAQAHGRGGAREHGLCLVLPRLSPGGLGQYGCKRGCLPACAGGGIGLSPGAQEPRPCPGGEGGLHGGHSGASKRLEVHRVRFGALEQPDSRVARDGRPCRGTAGFSPMPSGWNPAFPRCAGRCAALSLGPGAGPFPTRKHAWHGLDAHTRIRS